VKAIAIDGPAGAGKTTIARAVAEELGWRYVDTGAMYRAIALAAIERGVDPGDETGLERLARSLRIEPNGAGIELDGTDVSARIRERDVTRLVSQVAAHARVRAALVSVQRRLARDGSVVMEGRDIGSAVLPDAELKIFLTASADERARRRARQLGVGDDQTQVEDMRDSMVRRDAADSTREHSPMQRASDAVAVDTTNKNQRDVAAEIVALAKSRADGR
jgi:cytidylate kinase